MTSLIYNSNCGVGPYELVNGVNEMVYVHQGKLKKFLFHRPSLEAIEWNTRRLILVSQEIAIELQRERDRPYGVGNFQMPLFKENQILTWEGQAVTDRCMILNVEEEFVQDNTSADSVVRIDIIAITATQNRRPIAGRVARFYLSALESALMTFPETEFIWRPPDATGRESDFERLAWIDQRPGIIRTASVSRLDSASFGGNQLAGQFALTIRLEMTAGLAR